MRLQSSCQPGLQSSQSSTGARVHFLAHSCECWQASAPHCYQPNAVVVLHVGLHRAAHNMVLLPWREISKTVRKRVGKWADFGSGIPDGSHGPTETVGTLWKRTAPGCEYQETQLTGCHLGG